VSGALRSMTGYGSAAIENDEVKASVTVRSLNHRYLDLSVHVSRRLLPLENDIRRAVQSRLQRGRVEVSLQASLREQEGEVLPNRPLIAGLVRALRDVQRDHDLSGEIQVTDLMRFPGAFEAQDAGPALEDGHRDELLRLLGEALDGLEQMRMAEGERLCVVLLSAVQAVEAAAQRIEGLLERERGPRLEALQAKARTLLQDLSRGPGPCDRGSRGRLWQAPRFPGPGVGPRGEHHRQQERSGGAGPGGRSAQGRDRALPGAGAER
jgi:uncharacterized protein (TIGR00255 family)